MPTKTTSFGPGPRLAVIGHPQQQPVAFSTLQRHLDATRVGVPKHVVEITRHDPGRLTAGGHLPARAAHLGWGQQTALDVAGHLQLAPPELLCHQLLELQALDQVAPALGSKLRNHDITFGRFG